MVVIESLALGVPVLTSYYPAAAEQINEGVDGYVVDAEYESIKQKVIELLTQREVLESMKNNLNSACRSNDAEYNQFIEAVNS